MTGLQTIRARLTAWYVLGAATLVTTVALASWLVMHASVHQTIDRALLRNLTTATDFIEGHTRLANPPGGAVKILQSGSFFGLRDVLVRAFDDTGEMVYESESLAGHHLSVTPPAIADDTVRFRNDVGESDWRVRFAYRRVTYRGERLIVEVAEPLSLADSSLASYGRLLLIVVPLALGLSALGGYWISGRALAPVERITEDARAISALNLSARLAVPHARDELQQLTQTLNAMLERIERAVRQTRQFTADASHELRAPLTLIQTAAEFSLRRDRPKEELADALKTILREAQRTGQITDNLLTLARADAGELQVGDAVTIDMGELCHVSIEQARLLATGRTLDISADVSAIRLNVSGDDAALRRLLLILMDNAVKYTPDDGSIRLTLTRDGERAVVHITDTGIGIAAEDLPHVFDRFWRADKVRSRALGGTGLGLAIAQSIVSLHHGSLTATSEPGRGSTFTVRLPLAAAPARQVRVAV